MRIAVVVDTWFPAIGGGQINAFEISKRIASRHFQIDILTRNNGRDNPSPTGYLKIFKLGPKSTAESSFAKIVFALHIFVFLMSRNYNLIHVHPFLPAIPAKIVSLIKKIPIIFTVHGTRLFENNKIFSPSLILEWIILTKIKYDCVISVTNAFTKIANVNKKIRVISNGIDLTAFNNVKAQKTSFPKILWVGRFDKVKRVDDLIFAMKDVVKSIPNVQLTLVGYGYEKNSLQQLVKKLSLEKYVKFAGKKQGSDLIKEYKSSHLFVLPSSSEGSPLTLLEAQAAKVAVVATNVGGMPEIIKQGVNGLLIPPNKPEILAHTIIKGLKNREYLGNNGYENIKKHYSWEEVANKTLQTYENLLNAI